MPTRTSSPASARTAKAKKKSPRVGSTATLQGRISQISLCPHGLLEGLVVSGAFAKVPPHHDAERALSTLRVGSTVEVVGKVIATKPTLVIDHVTITNKRAVIFDQDEIEEHEPPAREPRRRNLDLTGKITAIGTRKHGEIDRLLLSGNVSVHLGHDELEIAVAVGDKVRVLGKGTPFPHGTFVHADEVARVAARAR